MTRTNDRYHSFNAATPHRGYHFFAKTKLPINPATLPDGYVPPSTSHLHSPLIPSGDEDQSAPAKELSSQPPTHSSTHPSFHPVNQPFYSPHPFQSLIPFLFIRHPPPPVQHTPKLLEKKKKSSLPALQTFMRVRITNTTSMPENQNPLTFYPDRLTDHGREREREKKRGKKKKMIHPKRKAQTPRAMQTPARAQCNQVISFEPDCLLVLPFLSLFSPSCSFYPFFLFRRNP